MSPRPHVDDLAPMLRGELRWSQIMVRMIDNDVARPARASLAVKSGIRRERLALEVKRREIIGINQHVKRVRHSARSGIERTPVSGHLRPVLPVRRDRHPLTQQRMPAKLAHAFDCGTEAGVQAAKARTTESKSLISPIGGPMIGQRA